MHRRLLELLVEPGTHAPLRLEVEHGDGDRVEDGWLRCDASGRSYPIVRGIPRFSTEGNYSASFGWQWNRFRDVQIDTETGAQHSRQRFDQESGWGELDLSGRWVLDAGCGAGRFAEVAASRGARLVALDYSSAVDAAAKTLKRFDNVDVVQANILELPFRRATFDFAFCIGVIQHTPRPEEAIRSVVDAVKPGGRFCFTIYKRRPWTRLNGKYVLRSLTKRMRRETLLRAIEGVMPIAFPVTNVLYRVPLANRVARFMMPIPNHVARDGFTREQRYREAILDTFDALSPAYDSPLTVRETTNALRQAAARTWNFRSRIRVVVEGVR
jgi:SAM-dependent methyltransferase